MNELYIGASGLPQRWSDCFRHLSVLEVVESGYQVLRRKTVKRWRTDAPEGFEFVLALDQRISHPHEMTREMMSDAQREAPSLLGSFQTNDQVMAIWAATVARVSPCASN